MFRIQTAQASDAGKADSIHCRTCWITDQAILSKGDMLGTVAGSTCIVHQNGDVADQYIERVERPAAE